MSTKNTVETQWSIGRRDFLKSAAVAGAGIALTRSVFSQQEDTYRFIPREDDLKIALVGLGAQGQVLRDAILRIPGVRFAALCDVWPYHLNMINAAVRAMGHEPNTYVDYREMIAAEKDRIDAVVVATPDWVHHEISNACMEAGLHVYCEKEMSNNLANARSMVETSRRTGRLLQIGHQRRSNPRYVHAFDRLIRDNNLLGRVTHAYGQWNRSVQGPILWPEGQAIRPEQLERFGYDNMMQFRNWRWYKRYGGGPIVDLGSHQIDLFSWVFGTDPKSVTASGGRDYYPEFEWYDNVLCIFEYDTPAGVSRAMYQVLTTSSHGGFYETFMGENGTIQISEVPDRGNTAARENRADTFTFEGKTIEAVPDWGSLASQGLLSKTVSPLTVSATRNIEVDVRDTLPAGVWPLPVPMNKLAHQYHLENFFNAIRFNEKLTCPGEVGYETAVAVLKVNEAVEARRTLDFHPEEFKA